MLFKLLRYLSFTNQNTVTGSTSPLHFSDVIQSRGATKTYMMSATSMTSKEVKDNEKKIVCPQPTDPIFVNREKTFYCKKNMMIILSLSSINRSNFLKIMEKLLTVQRIRPKLLNITKNKATQQQTNKQTKQQPPKQNKTGIFTF